MVHLSGSERPQPGTSWCPAGCQLFVHYSPNFKVILLEAKDAEIGPLSLNGKLLSSVGFLFELMNLK